MLQNLKIIYSRVQQLQTQYSKIATKISNCRKIDHKNKNILIFAPKNQVQFWQFKNRENKNQTYYAKIQFCRKIDPKKY